MFVFPYTSSLGLHQTSRVFCCWIGSLAIWLGINFSVIGYILKNLKWTGMAIPFWVRKYMWFASHLKIYLLYWNGIYIFIKHFIFNWEWKTRRSNFRMGSPFLKRISVLRLYMLSWYNRLIRKPIIKGNSCYILWTSVSICSKIYSSMYWLQRLEEETGLLENLGGTTLSRVYWLPEYNLILWGYLLQIDTL